MNRADIDKLARKVIADHLGLDDVNFDPAKTFEDLGGDSLDQVEVVMALEEQFDVEIGDDDAVQGDTLEKVIELIDKKLNPTH